MKNRFAESLNQNCACITINESMLQHMMGDELSAYLSTRPHLFSSTSVFISENQFRQLEKIIQIIEETIADENFKRIALLQAPEIALKDWGTSGSFTAYDFHLSEEGPMLIEINTNAGGALINTYLARVQEKCCASDSELACAYGELVKNEKKFMDMLFQEWKQQKGASSPKTIAIVDDNPEEQYLYPEFLLFQKLFSSYGLKTIIADPARLVFNEGKLRYQEENIDLVYNRVTDFYFKDSKYASLALAYDQGAVVLTPSPRHHALYAHKKNLVYLSDPDSLKNFNLSQEKRDILLTHIPKTLEVTRNNQDKLWMMRKELFFKPFSGFGSKAAYRGDKITKKVWEEILDGDYVAQKIVPPSRRIIKMNDQDLDLKLDLRVYTYQGNLQLLAARLYEGQTTNFRTQGGGFAPVIIVKDQ